MLLLSWDGKLHHFQFLFGPPLPHGALKHFLHSLKSIEYFNAHIPLLFSVHCLKLYVHWPQATNSQPRHNHLHRPHLMCHQLMHIYECGHLSNSKTILCARPSKECGSVFLRQEIEDIRERCKVLLEPLNFRSLADTCQGCQKAAEAQTPHSAVQEDEGYWD